MAAAAARAAPARRDQRGVSVHHGERDHHFVHRRDAAGARPDRLVHLFLRSRLRRRAAAVPAARRAHLARRRRPRSCSPKRPCSTGWRGAASWSPGARSSTRPTTSTIAAAPSGSPTTTCAGFLEQTVRAVKSGPERKFIYAYWPQFDALSHQHGVGSAEVRAHFDALDACLRRNAGAPGGHGHDAGPHGGPRLHRLSRRRNPWNCLPSFPPCFDSRCAASGGSRFATFTIRRSFIGKGNSSSWTIARRFVPAGNCWTRAGSAPGARIRVSRSESATWRLS